MEYISTTLKEEFKIKKIITVHYFEYTKNFIFYGEKHNFWEFVYIDKGEMQIVADKTTCNLHQGEIIFHKPNEFHNIASNGIIPPNPMIVSFECNSRAMSFFNNKVFNITNEQKNILSQIIKEATRAFSTPLGNPYIYKLDKLKNPHFASEQMIKILLEMLLISIYRNSNVEKNTRSLSILKEHMHGNIADDVIEFLNNNIGNKITFDDVVKFANISKTSLKSLFKEQTDMGVMQYFNSLKIDRAKLFIREDNYNFTQIANLLNYDTIHYFSYQFKKITGMSPTEYSRSIKINIE